MISLKERLKQLVEGKLEMEGIELVDVAIRGGKRAKIVQFFVDKKGGITVGECSRISRELSDLLDYGEEPLEIGPYRLEVSSPGLDRPLVSERDFRRNIGKEVLFTYSAGDTQEELKGRIVDVKSDGVYVKGRDDRVIRLHLDSIRRAKVLFEW